MSEIPGPYLEKIEAARRNKLKALDLSYVNVGKGGSLHSIPPAVLELGQLESLDLSGHWIQEVPDEIGELSSLKTLNLANNRFENVPPSLGRLKNLEELYLDGNRLKAFSKKIGELPKLTTLWLQGGAPTPQLPEWLPGLRGITEIGLVNFGLSHVPNWMAQWTGLKELYLKGNRFSVVPDWIGRLQNLRVLSLVNNQLTDLPGAIGDLLNLRVLQLWGNRLTFVPEAVYRLSGLRKLHLSREGDLTNEIREISSQILHIDELEELWVSSSLLEVPPPEIADKGLPAIREYFRQLETAGTDHLYEAKLLIVGEGGAGKTTLVKKITDPQYQLREEDTTRGIDVVRWHFPFDDRRTFQVNIWDFGGQEVYHATHQFFLTKRSLYALVADVRKEDTDFYYWLNVAELLSDGSPIIIIKNEKQDRHREINERALRGRFTNLKETLATNLATGRGLDKVKEEIQHQITQLPHVGTPLPATWVRVREALERDPRNYISLEEYLSICGRHGFAGLKARLQLSEYLHDLGVCLHFQDDPLLKRTVILRPKWGTDAVYKVLDNPRVIRNLGRFTRADLEHIWNEPEYTDVHDELLQLMMKFKLCYALPGVADTYIAPQLLSANQQDFHWEDADKLLLRYSYDFMPKGILTQFIVAMHALIAEQRLVWKSGVVLSKEHTLAEVTEHYERREIRIRVAGKHRKDLLVIVSHELDKIHASFPRLEYSKLVPCNCSACKSSTEPHFYSLGVLRRFIEDRQSHIQCQISYEMVDVLGLVDDLVVREQLRPQEAWYTSGHEEEFKSQVLFQGPIEQVVLQQISGGERILHLEKGRGDKMTKPASDAVKARSAWANGSFYLAVFVIVTAALGFLARAVPGYVLPIILIAGAIFIPLIGALQLRMDERLSQKSFLELMKLVVGQLPLIRRISKQQSK